MRCSWPTASDERPQDQDGAEHGTEHQRAENHRQPSQGDQGNTQRCT
jgi:hypothetical protein